ncbi:hypothetical protein CARUB_v10021887mg [Capsella rubella]|uniref:F-box domain-containing protein n=1 Tax=Capsella rubella TaxID=81985 RepID=R0HWX6_9BRAS|nr:hypothetical protein CARUB_v10021887mg [Capsella rubella]
MVVSRRLPSDVEEEILVRVPPQSLLRFRSVCKEWYNRSSSKRFVNRNFAFARPEFMLKSDSHICSVSVDLKEDPTIKVTDFCFDFLRGRRYDLSAMTCDGYMFMYESPKVGIDSGEHRGVVWNPLLRHTKYIAPNETTRTMFMGYDGSSSEKIYKIIGYTYSINDEDAVLEFATNVWEVTHNTSSRMDDACYNSMVSLNGNMYWIAYNYPDIGEYFIEMLDFSKEMIKMFCIVPCKGKKRSFNTPVLSIYKRDRFSVLQQCIFPTREIKIWVTGKKIGNGDDGDDVVWINFMAVSLPDFPMICNDMRTSYFVDYNIYGKSFVLCYHDSKEPEAWVYIVRGDMCKKIKIDEVVSVLQSSVYIPSLITIS